MLFFQWKLSSSKTEKRKIKKGKNNFTIKPTFLFIEFRLKNDKDDIYYFMIRKSTDKKNSKNGES